jgi:isochorismate synthase
MLPNQLFEKASQHYKEENPFVLYSFPETQEVTGFFQKDKEAYTYEEEGGPFFIFQPFHTDKEGFVIPKRFSEEITVAFIPSGIRLSPIFLDPNLNEKVFYKNLVKRAMDWIAAKKVHKIVTTRKRSVPVKNLNIETLLFQLFDLYPAAFRYIWYHPKTGLWCGATPELLLESDGECFKTMALAGTKAPDDFRRVEWTEKERDEQQVVVDDISNKLQNVLSVIKISKTTNHTAGSIVHLRTDISGFIKKGKGSLFSIANTLHPTPAICGTPRTMAHQFITQHEGYDREYYTGFLGLLNEPKKNTRLYVNLRCMKLEDNQAHIFVGGGITIGSVPESEWVETENKLQTMLRVLHPFI